MTIVLFKGGAKVFFFFFFFARKQISGFILNPLERCILIIKERKIGYIELIREGKKCSREGGKVKIRGRSSISLGTRH